MNKQLTLQIGSLVVLALIGVGLLWRLPVQTPGVPQDAKTPDELTSVLDNILDSESTNEIGVAAALRADYIAEGYPSADTMSADLSEHLLEAYADGQLYEIQSLNDGYARTVSLVSVADTSEVNYEYCGLYSTGLCMIVYTIGDEQKIVRVFPSMRGAPFEIFTNGHVQLSHFLNDTNEVMLSTSFGDGPGGEKTHWTLGLNNGELKEIVKEKFGFDGDGGKTDFVFSRVDADEEVALELHWTESINEEGSTVYSYQSLVIRDESGVLKESALNLVNLREPVVQLDPSESLAAPGAIIFSVYEEMATDRPGVTRVYSYNKTTSPRLILLREIP